MLGCVRPERRRGRDGFRRRSSLSLPQRLLCGFQRRFCCRQERWQTWDTKIVYEGASGCRCERERRKNGTTGGTGITGSVLIKRKFSAARFSYVVFGEFSYPVEGGLEFFERLLFL